MELNDRVLYHQIHPLKLITDISSALLALVLFARHRLAFGLAALTLPAVIVSAYLIAFGRLEPLKQRPLGVYVARFMTARWMVIRLGGMALASFGAWERRWAIVVLGLGVIAAAWLQGLIRTRGPSP